MGLSDVANWWRVCYQRGLPRPVYIWTKISLFALLLWLCYSISNQFIYSQLQKNCICHITSPPPGPCWPRYQRNFPIGTGESGISCMYTGILFPTHRQITAALNEPCFTSDQFTVFIQSYIIHCRIRYCKLPIADKRF